MKIDLGKKYQTRNGRVVSIDEIHDGGLDARGEQKPQFYTGVMTGEGVNRWSLDGSFNAGDFGVPHQYDLVFEILEAK